MIFCRQCWNSAQEEDDGYFMSAADWKMDMAVRYECDIEDSHGTTQEAVWN